MKPKDKILPPIRPNAGLTALYRAKIEKLLEELHRSVVYWATAAYRQNAPAITGVDPSDGPLAQDEAPADVLHKAMADLSKRWLKRFDKGAQELAAYFAKAASQRSDAQLRAILKKAGFAVEFKLTPAQQDIIAATVQQNVALIRSLPEQYLGQVEQSVMRSVQTGRDVGGLVKELQANFGVTKRRASFIARDQNNKATASLNRARQIELGITQSIWVHSSAGKEPRPSHVKAGRDKVVFSVAEGWLDPAIDKRIWPGTEPNCRCVSRSIIPGFI